MIETVKALFATMRGIIVALKDNIRARMHGTALRVAIKTLDPTSEPVKVGDLVQLLPNGNVRRVRSGGAEK
jgi:hypothetical protein